MRPGSWRKALRVSKRSKVQELARQWEATLPPETRRTIPPSEVRGSALSPELAVQQKKRRDREREPFRAPRRRAPRGSVIMREAGNAILVPRAELERRARLTRADLEAAPAAFAADYFARPTPQDFWLACELRTLVEELSGFPRGLDEDPRVAFPDLKDEVPRKRLEELRRAWEGANGPLETYWEKQLRFYVGHALPYRQAGGKNPIAGDGESILKAVRALSPPDTVPLALTAQKIERVLRTATVARGGGTKGRTKNVETALDELILSVQAAAGRTP